MRRPARAVGALATSVAAWSALTVYWTRRGGSGDYPLDAGRALDTVLGGEPLRLLDSAEMGPLSLVARLPFVAAARALGAGSMAEYRIGSVVLLVIATWFAFGFVRRLSVRGVSPWALGAAAVIVVLSPMSRDAITDGHPEELLTGVLCVAAVVFAARGRPWAMVAALIAAALTKQWALVAVGPALAACVSGRRRVLILGGASIAAAIAVVLIVAPGDFVHRQIALIGARDFITWVNVWWLAVPGAEDGIGDGGLASLVNDTIHGVIVLLPLPLAYLGWRRRPAGDPAVTISAALGLLAAALLLRSVLDPWNNLYYHLPALITIAALELDRGRLPRVTLAITLGAYLLFEYGTWLWGADTASALYLLWALPILAWTIFVGLSYVRPWGRHRRVKYRDAVVDTGTVGAVRSLAGKTGSARIQSTAQLSPKGK